MRLSFVVTGPALLSQKENIKSILNSGAVESGSLNLEQCDQLTVNYKVDMPGTVDLFKRLRAAMELAEESKEFSAEHGDEFYEYIECVRILEDLVNLSESRRKIEEWTE